jgi:hypothetical protein
MSTTSTNRRRSTTALSRDAITRGRAPNPSRGRTIGRGTCGRNTRSNPNTPPTRITWGLFRCKWMGHDLSWCRVSMLDEGSSAAAHRFPPREQGDSPSHSFHRDDTAPSWGRSTRPSNRPWTRRANKSLIKSRVRQDVTGNQDGFIRVPGVLVSSGLIQFVWRQLGLPRFRKQGAIYRLIWEALHSWCVCLYILILFIRSCGIAPGLCVAEFGEAYGQYQCLLLPIHVLITHMLGSQVTVCLAPLHRLKGIRIDLPVQASQ